MKKLFILINHDLLESQIKEAKEILKVDEIVSLNDGFIYRARRFGSQFLLRIKRQELELQWLVV